MRAAHFGVIACTQLALLLAACQAPLNRESASKGAGDGEPAYVRIPASMVTPSFVEETKFNRDHIHDAEFAFGYIEKSELARLSSGVFENVVELDARSWAEHRFDPRTLQLLPNEQPAFEGFEDYHDYAALTAELNRIALAHPGIVELTSAGKTVENRDIWVTKISDNARTEEAEPKLLYIANMHGDEVVGREMMIYLIRRLADEYGRDDRITRLVDHAQIYIVASMNPDGFEARQRYNADGVDLNRDFPDFTSDPNDTPAGRAVETQAIMALHQRHHFVLAMNFHGGEVCFNMPWDTKPNTRANDRFGDDAFMSSAAREYADLNATMRANSGGSFDRGVTYGYEWYEVDGGMQDWSIYYRQSFHATLELSYSKWPAASGLPGFWEENKEPLIRYLEQGLLGVHLNVTAAEGAALGPISVRVSTADRDVVYADGNVHRLAVPGEQTVTVRANGYQPATISVTPWSFADDARNVTLVREK